MSRLKKPVVNVFIEDDHQDVLPHVFRAVGSKRLPVSNNVLIHFDSHPDLLLPSGLCHNDVHDDVYSLYDKLSIENWILPAAYMGIFKTIVWVFPPWSDQIPEGTYDFLIGRHFETDAIYVTCLESYFLSEGIVCDEQELVDAKEIRLIVIPVSAAGTIDLRSHDGYVLDFDLDFFSTKNPFLELYDRVNLYSRLKRIYKFEPVPPHLKGPSKVRFALETCHKRKETLTKLEHIFKYLETHNGSLSGYSGIGAEFVDEVASIVDDIETEYENQVVDWTLIHHAGCTCDDTDLPSHESTSDEIKDLFEKTIKFLQETVSLVPNKPDIVTVARSSEDEFTPKHQVEHIQNDLLNLLKGFLPDFKVEKGYEIDDESEKDE